MKNKKFLLLLAMPLLLVGCGGTSSSGSSVTPSVSTTPVVSTSTPESSTSVGSSTSVFDPEEGAHLTIAQVKLLVPNSNDETTKKFYVTATIKEVTDATKGHMVIEDETGEMEIYYSFSEDGEYRYGELADLGCDVPGEGDEATFYGILKNYKGTFEMEDARIQGCNYVPPAISEYTEMTVAAAREAADNDLVRIKGKVIAVTKNASLDSIGALIADETGSIYVYDDICSQLSVNDEVDIAGRKEHYISSSEASYAEEFGYKGSNQLSMCQLVSREASTEEADLSFATEASVSDIIDTDFANDISGKLYKVNGYIIKDDHPGAGGYTNYYIHGLDGRDSYVYSQASGADFTWLDQYCSEKGSEKVYTIYLTPLNAKSTSTGCTWRFLPVKVIDENFEFDKNEATKFVLDSFLYSQFESLYYADPNKELISTYSSTMLGLENVKIEYSSNNTASVFFETKDGKTYLHTGTTGKATVTIDVTLDGFASAQGTVEVEMQEPDDIEALNVKGAIDAADETPVTVRAIVGPSLINQPGFYLIDDTGVIAARLAVDDDIAKFNLGDEVIIKGKRDVWGNSKYGGADFPTQICISDVELIANLYGEHDYSTATFIEGKNAKYVSDLDYHEIIHTTEVYVIEGQVEVTGSGQSTQWQIVDPTDGSELSLYASSVAQYNWLQGYEDQTLTIEVAPVNWNNKAYMRGCILSITTADGEKVVNTYNFQ